MTFEEFQITFSLKSRVCNSERPSARTYNKVFSAFPLCLSVSVVKWFYAPN